MKQLIIILIIITASMGVILSSPTIELNLTSPKSLQGSSLFQVSSQELLQKFFGSGPMADFMRYYYELSKTFLNFLLIVYDIWPSCYQYLMSPEFTNTFINPAIELIIDVVGDLSNIVLTGDLVGSIGPIGEKIGRGLQMILITMTKLVKKVPDYKKAYLAWIDFLSAYLNLWHTALRVILSFTSATDDVMCHHRIDLGVNMTRKGVENCHGMFNEFTKLNQLGNFYKKFVEAVKSNKDLFSPDPKKFANKIKEICNLVLSSKYAVSLIGFVVNYIGGYSVCVVGFIGCSINALSFVNPTATDIVKQNTEALWNGFARLFGLFHPTEKVYEYLGLALPPIIVVLTEAKTEILNALWKRYFFKVLNLVINIKIKVVEIISKKVPDVWNAVLEIFRSYNDGFGGVKLLFSDALDKMENFGGYPKKIADVIKSVSSDFANGIPEIYSIMMEGIVTSSYQEAFDKAWIVVYRIWCNALDAFTRSE